MQNRYVLLHMKHAKNR